MIAEAESFMKVHKVRMSGEDIKSGTAALVIPQSLLNEFAEKLLETIPYAPVKGIYSEDDEDYTDHGMKRSEGRIYGIVRHQL